MKTFICLPSCQFGSMTAAERLLLIRARLLHAKTTVPKPKGIHAAANPDAKGRVIRPHVRMPGKPEFSLSGQFFGGTLNTKRKAWVAEPALKTSTSFKAAFRHRSHPLTKIAEKWGAMKRQMEPKITPKVSPICDDTDSPENYP